MKKIFIVVTLLVLVVTLCACNTEGNDNRMTLIYGDGFVRIYVDNETGIQYMDSHGTCVMVDENGKPLIYQPTKKGGETE